jgi:hypothetical protein
MRVLAFAALTALAVGTEAYADSFSYKGIITDVSDQTGSYTSNSAFSLTVAYAPYNGLYVVDQPTPTSTLVIVGGPLHITLQTDGLTTDFYGFQASFIRDYGSNATAIFDDQSFYGTDLSDFVQFTSDLYSPFSGEPASNSYSGTGRFYGPGFSMNLTSAAPEPSTWTLSILGIGVLGGAMRRQRGTVFRQRPA